ncbi:MAG: FGGY-family carbohydrate kinase [Deltaproteobacteria bacterium]|nr:FGGY-family carbohydrate kinase [Deltaproteobacteria bacterium]
MNSKVQEKYILAVDHGSTGLKTSLFSTSGKSIDFEFEPTPITILPEGGAEQDPEEWWQATIKTCRRLVEKKSVPAEDIVAIGVSSTFSSTVAVGRNRKPLMNALTWADSRGAKYVRKIMGGAIEIGGYSLTNLLTWIPKTAGAPALSGKDDIAHVLYIKNAHPEIYANTHMFLGSKDYLNLRLSGEFASSPDSMTLFWVVNIKDIDNLDYDDRLIRKLDIDLGKLPPLKQATDILGNVRPEVADEIGIKRDVKVVVGSPDLQSAGVGAGTVEDYQGHIYIGTGSWIHCVVPYKKADVFHQIATFPHAVPGKYYTANAQDIAGGNLAFLKSNLIYYQNELNIQRPSDYPDNIYDTFNKIVEGVEPGAGKLIYTPWLHGERTPVDINSLRGGFHNMSISATMSHMIRAVYEGVAFNTRWMLYYVEKFIKRKMESLLLVGGGGNSDVWCQIFADVLDREIRQIEDPIQCNGRGAAFLAAIALGYQTVADLPRLVKCTATYSPNSDNRKIYDELYDAFLTIYKNNKKLYKRLNRQ